LQEEFSVALTQFRKAIADQATAFQKELNEVKAIADQATAFQKELNEFKAIADQANAKADIANAKADIANAKADIANAKADKALLESRASRKDARLHASSLSNSLTVRIIYDKLGFMTKHASSANTFALTLDGEKSWNGVVVPGAKEKIKTFAESYQNFVKSNGLLHSDQDFVDVRQVVRRWDTIKERRNLEQHRHDIAAKLSEMVGFYEGHIALEDRLNSDDQEFYNFFKFTEEFNMRERTATATAGTIPCRVKEGVTFAAALTKGKP
jgi:hypothetical protein